MLLRWYQAKLAKSPILTQSVTTGALFTAGDILAQQGIESRGLSNHDVFRTARMGFYGGFIFGPMVVHWYRFLERVVQFPGRKNLEIVGRVAADQLIFTPVNMLFFFSGMALLEGGSPREKLKSSYKSTLLTNWMVWPAVQLINFKFTPLNHRLLVVNLVSLGWNSYLSLVNSKGVSKAIASSKQEAKSVY